MYVFIYAHIYNIYIHIHYIHIYINIYVCVMYMLFVCNIAFFFVNVIIHKFNKIHLKFCNSCR